ncbi:hypothetical protein LOTGIDRAFT_168802 [Lottia gigantea]|uniref:C-type lectin domain-containing protein n=1 Tax=Lottia gigantea TaxID=225164 RepID=V3ZJF4_LOTGI|nr:hypothetical protein LOTGIDRAFT_168802 [Lottia gigantea]ESO84357.1 hypothetical protein LOTGIDRAFT_168802 [Lottia gigantea]
MEKTYFISVVLLFIYFMETINTNTTFLIKKSEFDNRIIRKFVLEQVNNTETVTTCVYRCVRDLNCVSFFYNQNQKRCQTNSVGFITPGDGEEESGTKYYSLYEEGCPADFIRNRNLDLCYKPYIETKDDDFGEARDLCVANSYVLVRGKTTEDYKHISDQLRASTDYASKKFWIDGSDSQVEGVWKFDNGQKMTAFFWAQGEPDNTTSGKDNVYLRKSSNGVYEMSDTQYYLDAYRICQVL